MIQQKQDMVLDYIYFGVMLLGAAIFIFEIPYAVFYSPLFMLGAFFVYKSYRQSRISVSLSMLILSVFAVVYVAFIHYPGNGLYYDAYIHIHAVILFLMGYNFLSDKEQESRLKYAEYFFTAVSLFYIAYAVLTVVFYYKCTDAALEYRQYYSFWYASTKKPATVLSMSMVIPLCTGIYYLFYGKRTAKITGILLIAFTVALNIQTSTRTLLFLLPVIFLAELVFWLLLKKKKTVIGFVTMGVCLIIVIAFLITYKKIFAYLDTKFPGSLFSRILEDGLSFAGRVKYSLNVLEDFSLTYLGGGIHSRTVGTPHNIWLYIYDWGGIFSFIIYMAFTVVMTADFVLMFINRFVSVEFKMLLATLMGVICVEFFMEPFILPLPSFYILCMFVFGLTAGISTMGRQTKKLIS